MFLGQKNQKMNEEKRENSKEKGRKRKGLFRENKSQSKTNIQGAKVKANSCKYLRITRGE
jgi:hypothetical protein